MANLADCVAHGIQWFHSFDLPDGESIKGYKSEAILRREAAAILPDDLTGKSVLDIGAWDGYFSFEAERRCGCAGDRSSLLVRAGLGHQRRL